MKTQSTFLILLTAILLGNPTRVAGQINPGHDSGDFLFLFDQVTRGLAHEMGPGAIAPAQPARPLIVRVSADGCSKCGAIETTWQRVEKEFSEEARIVVLDVSDGPGAHDAEALAEELGIAEFFAVYRTRTGTVALFRPDSRMPSKVLDGEMDFAVYRKALTEVSSS